MATNAKEWKLTHDRLTHLFTYDQKTGEFVRRVYLWGPAQAGMKVGSKHSCGYLECMIDGERYFLHRLAWFYVHKKWPDGVIDHINHDRKDNRISNLRDVSPQGNVVNSSLKCTNKTGHKGIYICSRTGKYVAQITFNYKSRHLGTFELLQHAVQARQAAEKEIHKLVYGGER